MTNNLEVRLALYGKTCPGGHTHEICQNSSVTSKTAWCPRGLAVTVHVAFASRGVQAAALGRLPREHQQRLHPLPRGNQRTPKTPLRSLPEVLPRGVYGSANSATCSAHAAKSRSTGIRG